MSDKERLAGNNLPEENEKALVAQEGKPSELYVAVENGEIDLKQVLPKRSSGTWMDQFNDGF